MPPIDMGTQNLYAWSRFTSEQLLDDLAWEARMEQLLKNG